MFSRHSRKVKILFGLTDIALVALAFVAAYETRSALHFARVFSIPYRAILLLLLVCSGSWVAIGYWLDVYDKLDSAHTKVILRDTFRQCSLGIVCLVVAQYLSRLDLSRPFVVLFGVYAWTALCLFRIYGGPWIGRARREFGNTHFIMVVGCGERALALGRSLEKSADYGIRLMGFLDPGFSGQEHTGPYPVHPLNALPKLLGEHVIDEIIFAVDSHRLSELEDVFLLCDEEGVRTRVIVDFFPHVNSDVYLERLGSIPLLTFSAAPHDEIRLLLKRGTDVVLAAAGLFLLLPLMGAIAFVIRITSPGPAIFRQVRCGLNGRRFMFYKFRSMCEDAEAMKPQLMHLNQKQTAFKITDDPRLTGIGRVLRKFSVDEWPQLWNVLRGDMSLVGPRPAVPDEVDRYQRWQRRRLRMRPGLTCLWAVSGRDELDFDTWMKMDMQYIDNWSLWLDWKILLLTIPHVITGKGAH